MSILGGKKETSVAEDTKTVQGLNRGFNFLVPSEKTLKSTSRNLKYGCTLSTKGIEIVKKIIAKKRYYGVSFDETDIREGIEFNEKDGLIYGLEEPFHAKDLKKDSIVDDVLCPKVLQAHLIFAFGLQIPVANWCIPKKKADSFTFKKIESLIQIFNSEKTQCLFTVSDGSSTGDYFYKMMKVKHPEIFHLYDHIHLTKNFRNRMLSALLCVETDEEEIRFNIRTLIDLLSEVDSGEAKFCKIPAVVVHPRDKMDMDPVKALLAEDIQASCNSSKTPSIRACGFFLQHVLKYFEIFHTRGAISSRKEELMECRRYFSCIKGLANTGVQCLRTIENILKLIEFCPDFEASGMNTNSVEVFFSVIKGFFSFFSISSSHNRNNPLSCIKSKNIISKRPGLFQIVHVSSRNHENSARSGQGLLCTRKFCIKSLSHQ